jgi:hypothetical protein
MDLTKEPTDFVRNTMSADHRKKLDFCQNFIIFGFIFMSFVLYVVFRAIFVLTESGGVPKSV